MKILITGITGLFGSYLAKEFLELGEIHGLKRKESSMDLLGHFSDRVHWHDGDINDYESLELAFKGKDLIIHCAGLVSFDAGDQENLLKTNTEGTQNVVNAMLESGIKRLLYISSVAAIGRPTDVSFLNENSKWTGNPLDTDYARSKYLAELEVWRAVQEGLSAMIFNPSVLLGRIADKRSSSGIYDYVLKENNYFPTGNINYLDVRDAAQLVRMLYQRGNWNERFILNGESISYESFFGHMAEAFNKRPPTKPFPYKISRLVVFIIWLRNQFNKNKIPLNLQTVLISKQKIFYDNEKVNTRTGFQYRSLDETFKWAIGNER